MKSVCLKLILCMLVFCQHIIAQDVPPEVTEPETIVQWNDQSAMNYSIAEFGSKIFDTLIQSSGANQNIMFAPGNMAEAFFLLSFGLSEDNKLKSEILNIFGNDKPITLKSTRLTETSSEDPVVSVKVNDDSLLKFLKNSAALANDLSIPETTDSNKDNKNTKDQEQLNVGYAVFIDSTSTEPENLLTESFLNNFSQIDKDVDQKTSTVKAIDITNNPVQAAESVNNWANLVSKEMIPSITDADSIKKQAGGLLLASSFLYQGAFTENFDDVSNAPVFTKIDGSTVVEASYMELTESQYYTEVEANGRMVTLTFQPNDAVSRQESESEFVLDIILPELTNFDDSNNIEFSTLTYAEDFFKNYNELVNKSNKSKLLSNLNSAEGKKAQLRLKELYKTRDEYKKTEAENDTLLEATWDKIEILEAERDRLDIEIEEDRPRLNEIDVIIQSHLNDAEVYKTKANTAADFIDSTQSEINILVELKQAQKEVKLVIPKLTITGKAELKNTLEDLGLTSISSPNAVDNLVKGDARFKISKVTQDTSIQMTITGFKAAAITTIAIEALSFSTPIDFVVDRPYFMVLRNQRDNSIHFMTYINSPEFDSSKVKD